MAPNTQLNREPVETPGEAHVYHEVDLSKLARFTKLQTQVRELVRCASWWDRHGKEWCHVIVAMASVPVALMCLAGSSIVGQVAGVFLLGVYHSTLANRFGHTGTHSALFESPSVNSIFLRFCIDFIGGFSTKLAHDTHVKVHHPHTNIIGLGDSSTWRIPQVPRYPYMFLIPLTLPVLTPMVALYDLIRSRDWRELALFSVLCGSGFIFHGWLLMHFSGFSYSGAACCLLAYRAVFAIPYIHINIFQHIGLPMYSADSRPARIYQMATGCLNLDSQWLLDFVFGHSLISCHVEHHLFPRLSDNMCLKVKPLVRRYLLDNGLPYHEDSYTNRVGVFLRDYDTLMVQAPPITHFVGIQ